MGVPLLLGVEIRNLTEHFRGTGDERARCARAYVLAHGCPLALAWRARRRLP